MLTYLLLTRNRPECLNRSLDAIGTLSIAAHEAVGGAEVVVVDDASDEPPCVPGTLRNGVGVTFVRRRVRAGAASRNLGVAVARGDWIVMLDDDSYPLDDGLVDVVREAHDDVAAIGAEIMLPDGTREHGGLPEVIIGCGAAVRRDAFLSVGGYDAAFDYYGEEYDLCAKLMMNGLRIIHDWRARVLHRKVPSGRDMNRILARLVRNNGWVMQRYAPDDVRERMIEEVVNRYQAIAAREQATAGFADGLAELQCTKEDQPRTPMPIEIWNRFTGLAHARRTLLDCEGMCGHRIALVDEGKNAWVVRAVLGAMQEDGLIERTDVEGDAEFMVIGTMSPGPMLDAWERRSATGQHVIAPWRPYHHLTQAGTALYAAHR